MVLVFAAGAVNLGWMLVPGAIMFVNVWVTYPPFVWLPSAMVLAAWAGHLVIFRRLWADRR